MRNSGLSKPYSGSREIRDVHGTIDIWGPIVVEVFAPYAEKILAPHAKLLAKKVGGWLGLTRWQIEQQVKSKTGLDFDGAAYRSWLKSLDARVWERPVEQAGPELALDLDDRLEAASRDWRDRRHNASTAMKLVQETYLSALAQCSQTDSIRFGELWSRERMQATTQQLANLASTRGGLGRLDGADLVAYLGKRSRARRSNRLAALGVDDSAISVVLDAASIPTVNVPRGKIRCVVGPFGIGKSEAAEQWHRTRFEDCLHNPDAPIPVWLHVRDINGNLTAVLDREAGSQAVGGARGLAVVVDGLDETDSSAAENILNDSRVFLASSPRSSFLLTTRPGVVSMRDGEEVPVSPLTNEEAASLVDAASGESRNSYYRLPEPLRESVRRPLFAIAAGRALAGGDAPLSAAGLLSQIVEKALRRGQERTRIESQHIVANLTELAVRLTNDPSESRVLDYSTRAVAEASRLVSVDSEGGSQFSLAIIQQWFAAQALISDPARAEDAFRDQVAFGRWRWAIAIVIAAGSNSNVDRFLSRAMKCNPGAASWLLAQASVSSISRSAAAAPPLIEVQSRLLKSGRSWADALGPLASKVLPVNPPEHGGLKLGVRLEADGIAYSWSREPQESDSTTTLPTSVHLFGADDDSWSGMSWKRFGHDAAWPWNFVRSDINQNLETTMRTSGLLGGTSGVWAEEAAYKFCRVWNERGTVFHKPIECEPLIQFLDGLLNDHPDIVIEARRGPALEAKWLRDYLGHQPGGVLQRPLPMPDVQAPNSGWVWGVYSRERLLEYAVELYGRACLAYEELCSYTFGSFDWTLSRFSQRPISVIGVLRVAQEIGETGRPTVGFRVLPTSLMERAVTESSYEWRRSITGRCAMRFELEDEDRGFEPEIGISNEALHDWMKTARESSPFVSFSHVSSVLETNHDRASSEIALQWLADDLKAIGMFSGHARID